MRLLARSESWRVTWPAKVSTESPLWSATWTEGPASSRALACPAGAPQDAAAVLHGGTVAITSAKHHLPNYGVFDEFRYFVPGDTLPVFRLTTASGDQVDIAVAICEDLWQDGGPVAVAARGRGAGSCSCIRTLRRTSATSMTSGRAVPATGPRGRCRARVRQHGRRSGRARLRRRLIDRRARWCGARARTAVRRGACCSPTWTWPRPIRASPVARERRRRHPDDQSSASSSRRCSCPNRTRRWRAYGIDRLTRSAEIYGLSCSAFATTSARTASASVVSGLSGGIDSALVATIAADALGPDRVHVVLIPGPYSLPHSVSDAADLAGGRVSTTG